MGFWESTAYSSALECADIYNPPMRIFLAVLLVVCSVPSFAWGPEGHRVVADVARDHLNAQARRAVVQLLGNDDLASVSNWADEIRRERRETYGWHFVDIPWDADGFSESRDCYKPTERDPSSFSDHHNCIVDRIDIFERGLADRRASRGDRVEALKFLVHFVGDVHQPLHAVARARGGNDIYIVQFGSSRCGSRPCDLHGAWDFGLIEHTQQRGSEYVELLEKLITSQHLEREAGGNPEGWANESFRLAHEVWLNDGGAVDQSYYRRNIPIVDQRLALAGIRLAQLLNDALGK
jgi:nuclease S1